MIADKIFLTKGVGVHKEQLTSFEIALRNAGIAPFNLVYVSSIYPPNCKYVSRGDGLAYQIVLLPLQLVWRFRQTAIPMVIFPSTTFLGRPTKKPASMRKIWRLQCWPQLWGLNLILIRPGMSGNKFSK